LIINFRWGEKVIYGFKIRREMERKVRENGFTLIELMVAVFIGAIVIWGVYTVYAGGQRIFHEEHRISQSQLSVRLGMDVVKNDIKRAGFLSSPNTDVDPIVCRNQGGPSLRRFHAIVHIGGVAGTVFNSSGQRVSIPNAGINTNIAPDAIILTGNYVSATSYLAETIIAGAGTIRFQDISRRLLPGEPPDTLRQIPTDGEFAMMFPIGGYVRVVNKYGFMMFSKILSVSSSAERTITVEPLPDASLSDIRCGIDGFGEGSEVNVVNAVMYRIEVDPSNPLKTDLVRWEVTIGDDGSFSTIDGTREVVVEYAVDFQVWFREDVVGFQGPRINYSLDIPPDNVVVVGNESAVLDGSANAHPENLRVAIVRLSVRTAEEDPKFPFVARPAGAPLTRFELNPSAMGSAHVRTLNAQVELPNISLRNMKN
jgi:prepilin-type N-terminal cleavage/methylation domain-containing protein